MIRVRALQGNEFDDWNAYVGGHNTATFCHLAEWKTVLEKAYGMETHYLVGEVDGSIKGILPLAEVRSLFFGHTLVSTPFCVYGGVLSDSDEVAAALVNEAINIGEARGVDYIEFRNTGARLASWPSKEFYFTFEKKMHEDVEDNFRAIPRKQRAMVRKGIENGLVSEVDQDVHRFFRVYSESVRDLGTPVYPCRYFEILMQVFNDCCRVLTILKDGQPVSSVLGFYYAGAVIPYYGGGTAQARKLKAHDFMYWELMRRSVEDGISVFDFGRSIKGSGSFSFKKNWGFEPKQLYYNQYFVNANEAPDLNPADLKYRLPVALWKRLPLPLANFIGPLVSRGLN